MATSILEDRSCRHLSSVPDLPDELVQEILTRLPVKSLMRFKCVSKLWQSIILNPSFASAYRGGFRGVLIDEAPFRWFSPTKDFFYLNLFDDDDNDETVNDDNGLKSWTDDEIFDDDDGFNCKSSSVKYLCHSHTVDYGSGRELGSTDIVNGLVCFYIGNYSCLYNIATRETMELPLSQNDNKCCSYHLGFDPVNKLYKLLKIRPIYDEEDEYFNEQLINATWIRNLDSEILTLGIDRSWRHIDAAPREIVGRSVCFNGVVYWQDLTILPTYDDAGIIAFHLAQEKFEFISTPNNTYCLPRFAPGLALMAASSNGEVDIIGYGKGVGWCDQKKFKLPWKDASDIYPQGIFPDGKVLILDDDSFEGMYCPSRCYLYDPMEKKSTRVEICKSLSSPSNEFERYIDGYMSYFEENIIPLSCLSTATSSTAAPKLN